MLDLNGTHTPATPARPRGQQVDQVGVEHTAVTLSATTTVTPEPSTGRAHLLTEHWGWREVRDYVVTEIEARFGPFPRDYKKEYGVFSGFCSRFGEDAPRIAKAAFDSYDGMWASAPISINRFCKASDRYFSSVILAKINS